MSRQSAGDHSHGHSHNLNDVSVAIAPLASRIVVGLLALCAAAVIAGLVILWPSDTHHTVPTNFQSTTTGEDSGSTTVTGTVVAQAYGQCQNPDAGRAVNGEVAVTPEPNGPCILSTVELTSGADQGRQTVVENATAKTLFDANPQPGQKSPTGDAARNSGGVELKVGDKIVMSASQGPFGVLYNFSDFDRKISLTIWAALFAIAVVAVAFWRGLRSLIGLVFAFVVVLFFTLPSILDGNSPVAVAIVSSAAILFVVLYLAHGVSLRTSAALLGTLASLSAAGFLSWLAITTMSITGLSDEAALSLQAYQTTISMSGILLAGFIIGALGVLNDVTITQASSVYEISHAAGDRNRWGTFTAAMRVGRDHIASTVYTLVFAYAGSALPLLLLFSVAGQQLSSLITSDVIAVELARAFVGGIAIALSVPLTTAIAVMLVSHTHRLRDRRADNTPSGNPDVPAIATESAQSPAPTRRGGRHAMPDVD